MQTVQHIGFQELRDRDPAAFDQDTLEALSGRSLSTA